MKINLHYKVEIASCAECWLYNKVNQFCQVDGKKAVFTETSMKFPSQLRPCQLEERHQYSIKALAFYCYARDKKEAFEILKDKIIDKCPVGVYLLDAPFTVGSQLHRTLFEKGLPIPQPGDTKESYWTRLLTKEKGKVLNAKFTGTAIDYYLDVEEPVEFEEIKI